MENLTSVLMFLSGMITGAVGEYYFGWFDRLAKWIIETANK